MEIINKKKEKISKIPSSAPGTKKLLVELKVIWHGEFADGFAHFIHFFIHCHFILNHFSKEEVKSVVIPQHILIVNHYVG